MYTCFYLNSAPELISTQSCVLGWGCSGDSLRSTKSADKEAGRMRVKKTETLWIVLFPNVEVYRFVLNWAIYLTNTWKTVAFAYRSWSSSLPICVCWFLIESIMYTSSSELLHEESRHQTTGPVCSRNLRLVQKGLTCQSIYFHCSWRLIMAR